MIDGRGSYSIDQQRYNGQFGGHAFWEIKNGKKTRMVSNVTYNAITTDFWGTSTRSPARNRGRCSARAATRRASRRRPTASRTARRGCGSARSWSARRSRERLTSFKRVLGPFDATMVVIGGIIGSGIFINPVHRRAAARHLAAGPSGLGHRRRHRAGRRAVLRGAWRAVPEGGRAIRLPARRAASARGFPLRMGAAAHHRDRRDRGGRDCLCDLRAASRRRSGRRTRSARDHRARRCSRLSTTSAQSRAAVS